MVSVCTQFNPLLDRISWSPLNNIDRLSAGSFEYIPIQRLCLCLNHRWIIKYSDRIFIQRFKYGPLVYKYYQNMLLHIKLANIVYSVYRVTFLWETLYI